MGSFVLDGQQHMGIRPAGRFAHGFPWEGPPFHQPSSSLLPSTLTVGLTYACCLLCLLCYLGWGRKSSLEEKRFANRSHLTLPHTHAFFFFLFFVFLNQGSKWKGILSFLRFFADLLASSRIFSPF
jgi:hypothetical protein